MNEFQEHVKKVQSESREGKYGWWNLVDDAKNVGLELEFNILTLRPMGPGFNIGYRAKYSGCEGVGAVTMSPQMYLVSFAKDTQNWQTLFEGFTKLYCQKPDVVYMDNQNNLITAEFWPDYDESKKKENLEQIMADPAYVIVRRE